MRVFVRVILSYLLLCLCCVSQAVFAESPILHKAKEFMAAREYQEAAEVLQTLLQQESEKKDEQLYLLGNTYFYRKEYERALDWFQQLRRDYPSSRWISKALFRQAECYTRLKRYQQAETIYAKEVAHLVSPERKEELAKIYLNFAEEYFSGSWVERRQQQGLEERPDFIKAKGFYELALQMELSAAKSEEIRFRIARCDFELGNYQESITTITTLQQEYPEGVYLTQARFYLGQSYLKQGQMLQARRVFRDFVEDYPDAPKAPEAAFLISRTYDLPNAYGAEALELGVKSLEDFLALYPELPLVPQAEYEIGLSYYNFSRYDDALIAFQSYLEKYESSEMVNSTVTQDSSEALEEGFTIADGLPLARYHLGKIYQQQRKFQEAIAAWQLYLQKYPSHSQWSEAQRQIIETEFLIADKLFREAKYEAARSAWERFLTAHPLDLRNPEIMLLIGESYVKQDLYQEAIAQWKRAVSKYPDTDPASQAQYEIGRVLESKLAQFEEAFAAYKLVSWGSYAFQAQERIREMQAKRLTVLTERSFRSNESPMLKITTRNIESLSFKMYRVDLESYFRKMQSAAGVDALDIALIDPDQSWEESVGDYEAYREFETDFTLPFSEPGAYLISCSEQNVSDEVGYEATTLVLISDLDMILKSTKHDVLVFAQNMNTGEVYPEVKLLFSDGQKIFFEGNTAKDGVLHQAFEELQDIYNLRVLAYDGKHYASNTLILENLYYASGLKSRGYIYSDRPAYRPGQQVNIKAIVREVDEQGVFRIPSHPGDDENYTLQVLSAQGSPVYQEERVLSEFGTLATDFQLSDASPLGEYRVLVTHGRESYAGHFLVEEYKLEKVKLTIETEREVYFRGESITGTIKAEYYYGEPLKEKSVTYSLAGLEMQSATTDEKGEIFFSLSTRDFAESQPMTLQARLDDENVAVGTTVWLATRGFSCELNTLRSVYLPGENIEVRVKTRDAAGNVIEKNLSLGVFKRETGIYGESAEVRIEELALVTDSNGLGSAMLRLSEGGEYVLRAEGQDRFGNPVSGQTELFISGEEDETMLRLFAETEEFKVGEEPEVTLFSRASEGLGLLTYEGESILSYQVLDISKERNQLPLTIGSKLAPNFTLAVAQMDGNRFHQAQKEFSVQQQLNIQITALNAENLARSEFFRPGERVKLEIRSSDQNGNPIAAEVSLAMVDEALYTQYAEQIPPIRDFFYDQRREFASETDSSCTFSFEAQTKEIVTEILDEKERFEEEKMTLFDAAEPLSEVSAAPIMKSRSFLGKAQGGIAGDVATNVAIELIDSEEADSDDASDFLQALREYFPETGYWNPSIVTGEDGKAVVEFTLPDSTTEWRFTSRGISHETLVGESTTGILTKLPFFAEMKTPVVLTEGDKLSLLASLHNYSGSGQEAELRFRSSLDSTLLAEQEQNFGIEQQQVMEIPYKLDLSEILEAPEAKSIRLELKAVAGDFQDRITRDVPLRPWGIEYVSRKSGTLGDDFNVKIALPENRSYRSQEMRILLNPALDQTLVELADDRPWPFMSPASSTVHEAQVLLNAIQSLEYSGEISAFSDEAGLASLQERLKGLLTEIALRQKQDGGWAWTGEEARSDLFVSADAVVLLSKAGRQGYNIQQQVLEKGVRFLQRAFQSARDNDIKSYLLYAMTVANDVDFAHVNRVYRERNSLSSSALASLSLTYSKLTRPEIAAELNARLLQQATIERDPLSGKELIFWRSKSPYPWLQGDIELTALALTALLQEGAKPERIVGIVDWLYAQRRWFGWGSMRANAGVSEALLLYFSQENFAENHYTLQISINGKLFSTVESLRERGAITLEVPAEFLKASGNTIAFDFEGRGSVNYVCLLQGLSRDVRQSKEQYTLTRSYEPAPLTFQGKEIPRGFSVLSGSYKRWHNKMRQVPLGEFGRVTLEYNRRDYDREHSEKNHRLMLEEPLPAGCSVLEQSLKGGFADYEIRDGKILFYLTNARYGTISYDLYGYLPGEYKVLPTKVQAPYFPERLDYGEPYVLTVLERGEDPDEEYKKTPDELYYYGKALFEAERYAEAGELLRRLFEEYRLKDEPYRESAKMLMYIAIAENNSREIVHYFEVMKEKYPDLLLSFEDILRVGRAYRNIQEYERAAQVLKATAEASFLKDVQISGSLETQGEFFASLDYTKSLLMEYPDIPSTESSFYALAQILLGELARSKERGEKAIFGKERQAVQEQAIAMLREFLLRYPENPIVGEVAFSLANAYIELEEFETVVALAQDFQQHYHQSPYLSAYEYIEAYGNFELERYERSLDLCRKVATEKYPDKRGRLRESDHKELAIYIMGQIYHSMGEPEKAIAQYEKVKERFPDAEEAIQHFRRKALELDEVSTFRPGEEIHVPLRYRNIKKVNLLAYRVDLMTLYLLQKNLNNISQINLAGITPYHEETVELGDGRDYADKEHVLTLLLEEEGAYLLVAKEDELDSSGMVLLTELEMEVDEDVISGRLRVNVKNSENGRYENKVHVKAIGSQDSEFVSGSTDLRGIFVADNIHGPATVIARKGDRYAFYRGSAALQPPDAQRQGRRLEAPADMRSQAMQQLGASNAAIQMKNEGYLRKNLYQNTQQGVEVQATY